MPLYETVMQEKPPVVLDIGTAYTKVGFAAEPYPRKIIPSVVVLSTSGQSKEIFSFETQLELYDQLIDFLQVVFFKHLLTSPKERKIVVVENVFGQTIIRETLAHTLFRHFEVSSVLFVPSHLICLASLAVQTGVVVDIGYSETTVMAIYAGVQIMKSFQDSPYGGKMVHAVLRKQLIEAGFADVEHVAEHVLEDIKIRTCFVTNLERANAYRAKNPPDEPPSIEYPINNNTIVTIPGRTRETAFEFMFEESNERNSLPQIILQAVLRCPVDVRRHLIESIFVVGGSAIIMGLLPRLRSELQHLLSSDPEYKTKFHPDTQFKFHKPIGRQNFAAWLGGSLCGATDLVISRPLTKESYVKNNHVPDWICLRDNRLTY